MTTDQQSLAAALGAHGEPCPACQAPLAADQRYCLNCGRRRASARVPYADLLAGRAPDEVLTPVAPPPAPPPPARRTLPPTATLGTAAAIGACVLGLGVLLGAAASGGNDPRQLAAAPVAQKPPVINVNAAPAGATEETFTADWPEGEEGWTVAVETLGKDATQVAAVQQAKSDATAKGAADVGALDSDDWPSLDPGEYVIYSGVFTGKGAKAKAKAAARKLKADFPEARAVEVSAGDVPGAEGTTAEEKPQEVERGELENLRGATGEEQQEKSARLPPTLELEGEAPPKDDKQAGGGTDAEVIE